MQTLVAAYEDFLEANINFFGFTIWVRKINVIAVREEQVLMKMNDLTRLEPLPFIYSP